MDNLNKENLEETEKAMQEKKTEATVDLEDESIKSANEIMDAPKPFADDADAHDVLSACASDSEEPGKPEGEEDIELATYMAECDSCAMRIYFEKDDLNENGNLDCPNCEEEVEINSDNLDLYLVEKDDEEDNEDYVVDCPDCEHLVHFKLSDIKEDGAVKCDQCGADIEIETDVLDAYKAFDEKAVLKKRKIKKTVLASVCGVIAGIAVALLIVCLIGMNSVIKVNGVSVPYSVYKCVYYYENAYQATSSGFNPEKSAHSQEFPSDQMGTDEGAYETWHDYFKEQTENGLKAYYAIYADALDNNYILEEDAVQDIDLYIEQFEKEAEDSGMSVREYTKKYLGASISLKELREYFTIRQTVSYYFRHRMSSYVTDEDIQKLYNENPDQYTTATFGYFQRSIDSDFTEKDAQKAVEAFSKVKSIEEFYKIYPDYSSEETVQQLISQDSVIAKDISKTQIEERPVIKDLLLNEKAVKNQVSAGMDEEKTYCEAVIVIEPLHKNIDAAREDAISNAADEHGNDFIEKLQGDAVSENGIGMMLTMFF